MKRIAEGGLAHFRIWIISAVLPMDDLQPFIDEVVPKEENESGIDFSENYYIDNISGFLE